MIGRARSFSGVLMTLTARPGSRSRVRILRAKKRMNHA